MYAAQIVQALLILSRKYTVSFLDDICVFAQDVPEMRKAMTYLFQDLHASHAMVSLSKMKIEKTEFTYLGFYFEVVDGILTYIPMTQKYSIFKDIEITDIASIMRFLGLVAFVSSFTNSLATLCDPLYQILSDQKHIPIPLW